MSLDLEETETPPNAHEPKHHISLAEQTLTMGPTSPGVFKTSQYAGIRTIFNNCLFLISKPSPREEKYFLVYHKEQQALDAIEALNSGGYFPNVNLMLNPETDMTRTGEGPDALYAIRIPVKSPDQDFPTLANRSLAFGIQTLAHSARAQNFMIAEARSNSQMGDILKGFAECTLKPITPYR